MKTATLKLKLKTDSGMNSTEEVRIENDQYGQICKILHLKEPIVFTPNELERKIRYYLIKNTHLTSVYTGGGQEDDYISFVDPVYNGIETEINHYSSQIMNYLYEK